MALGVCSPLQWRNRPRFSRGSLTFGSVMDGQPVHRFQRTIGSYARSPFLPSEIFCPIARLISAAGFTQPSAAISLPLSEHSGRRHACLESVVGILSGFAPFPSQLLL